MLSILLRTSTLPVDRFFNWGFFGFVQMGSGDNFRLGRFDSGKLGWVVRWGCGGGVVGAGEGSIVRKFSE